MPATRSPRLSRWRRAGSKTSRSGTRGARCTPATRALFPDDLAAQKRKLEDTLAGLVGALTEPEALAEMVKRLGESHARIGVEPGHYGPVGEALLFTLERGLGRRWTPEVQGAWTALYGEIATAMIRAQNAAALPQI